MDSLFLLSLWSHTGVCMVLSETLSKSPERNIIDNNPKRKYKENCYLRTLKWLMGPHATETNSTLSSISEVNTKIVICVSVQTIVIVTWRYLQIHWCTISIVYMCQSSWNFTGIYVTWTLTNLIVEKYIVGKQPSTSRNTYSLVLIQILYT